MKYKKPITAAASAHTAAEIHMYGVGNASFCNSSVYPPIIEYIGLS